MTQPGGVEPGAVRPPRWGRRIGAVVVLLLLAAGATIPWWGRDLAYFRIHDVEVRGTRFARPADIVSRLAIDTTASIWMSMDTLRMRVERHPQVDSARVRRWLPSKVIVEVTESEPVALVPTPKGMRAYEDGGRLLPLDPSRVRTDLPVVDAPDTTLFRTLAELRAANPAMYAQVSEVRRVGPDQWRFILMDVPVLAMRGVVADRFDELSSVREDLARRGIVPAELDLRFKDQVIVRLP